MLQNDPTTGSEFTGLDSAKTTEEDKKILKKKRRRPRTKALRCQLKILLEKAILGTELRFPEETFTTLDDGSLVAPLSDVFSHFSCASVSTFSKFEQLSVHSLKTLSKISRVFRITDQKPPQLDSQLKNKTSTGQTQSQLWLVVLPKHRAQHEERTVYIDNLPAQCSRAKLERRCSQFGAVLGMVFPRIGRIQRRIVQIAGGESQLQHSGFAFVQFASKIAAKRFCKRYHANSRLKRTHHSHRGQTKRNRLQQKQIELPTGDDDVFAESIKSEDSSTMAAVFVASEHEKNLLTSNGNEQEILNKGDVSLTSEPSKCNTEETADNAGDALSFVAPQVPQLVQLAASTGISVLQQGARNRCHSVAESLMSVDESGKDTDQEEKVTESGRQKMAKKRRRRRLKQRTSARVLPGQSLNNLFRHIQAFPFKQYKELRANYLKLKKARISSMKVQLQEAKTVKKDGAVRENTKEGDLKRTRGKRTANNSQKNEPKKIRKRARRKRGIRRLMNSAELAKLDSMGRE